MKINLLKRFGKDWTIKDNHIELIGDCKKQFESNAQKPLKITGHRIFTFLNLNRFYPAAITQMEMFKILKKENPIDANINMLTGQVAEEEIVKHLNKYYGNEGSTYPFTKENQGNVFDTTISDKFSALPDYVSGVTHAVFSDRKRKQKRIHEIKSAQKNKWERDKYQNYVLEVVDDSITVDNIVDNPNPDAIKQMYSTLSASEKASLTPAEKKQIKEYISNTADNLKSKEYWVSYIKHYGIKKWMLEGDLEHNLSPILKNTKSIKVKPKVEEKDYYLERWQKNGMWWAPEDYVYQVSSYGFQYNMHHKKVMHPENVKGNYNTEISVLFLDDDQMIIPKDSWFNKFDYIYKKPKPIKINKNNFIRIPIELDLHEFYTAVVSPCIKAWNDTIAKQKTQDLDTISWAILKKALRDNNVELNQFLEVVPSKTSPKVSYIKKIVAGANKENVKRSNDSLVRKNLVDIFYKEKEASKNHLLNQKANKKKNKKI